jgi:hypothetical protein
LIASTALQWRMPAAETLTLRANAIAGERYADDYAVIWRGMSVGRIMLGNGAPPARLCPEGCPTLAAAGNRIVRTGRRQAERFR